MITYFDTANQRDTPWSSVGRTCAPCSDAVSSPDQPRVQICLPSLSNKGKKKMKLKKRCSQTSSNFCIFIMDRCSAACYTTQAPQTEQQPTSAVSFSDPTDKQEHTSCPTPSLDVVAVLWSLLFNNTKNTTVSAHDMWNTLSLFF